MPRYPTFYLWGAVAGWALWMTHAPQPFPLLAVILMLAGSAGLTTSLAYLWYFEHWQWSIKAAAVRRFVRILRGWAARATN